MATIFGYLGAADTRGGTPSPYHVMIATPVASSPCTDYTRSLCGTAETLSRFGIRFDLHMIQGHCHVDDVRNMIIRDFLTSDCTDLFFIDADMGWKAKNFLRLLQVPGDIVAGVYTHKSDAFTFPFHPPQGVELRANAHGLYEMPKVATGFMRIRRPVLEALYKREQDKGRCSRPGDELGDVRRSPIPVARIVERGWPKELGLEEIAGNELYTSGDYVLCVKARALGFKVFLDPDMEFGHTGDKVWTGHFGNLYRQRHGLYQQEFCVAVAELGKGNTSLETFQALAHYCGVPDVGYMPWPLPPEALAEFYSQVKQSSGPVLEMGSGVSTLVAGLALAGTDRVVHALEHDVHFWDKTGKMLEHFKVPNVALHYVPLLPIEDGTYHYGVGDDLPEAFGLALLDGPPWKYGRPGAVKGLADRIKNAVLVVDDADREEELLTTLRATTHDFEIKSGERWWAVARPKVQAVREAAE